MTNVKIHLISIALTHKFQHVHIINRLTSQLLPSSELGQLMGVISASHPKPCQEQPGILFCDYAYHKMTGGGLSQIYENAKTIF